MKAFTLSSVALLAMLVGGSTSAATAPAAASVAAPAHPCAGLRPLLDPVAGRWIARGSNASNGKTVGLMLGVYRNGLACYFSYGRTELGGENPPTRDTLFEIGSVTKTFTATVLALDELRNPAFSARGPVNTSHIPCAGGLCLKLANGMENLTYLELATFTGGLPDDPTNLPGIDPRRYGERDFIAYLNGLSPPPAGLPAPDSYSNSSYGFLGQLLMSFAGYSDFDNPAVFRANFDRWIGAEITGPLSMSCTAADIASLPPACNAQAELASGYRHRQGRLVRVLRPWPWTPWGPAGALRSDARDLLHYTAAYLGAEQAGDVAVPLELSKAMALARAPADVKLVDGNGSQAYAWVVRNAANPARSMVYKNGGTAGYSSCIALWPAGETGVVLLMNSSKTHACKKGLALLRILAGPP